MQVETTAPRTLKGLLVVGPKRAKHLIVVALRKVSLNSV
jgi:hypothetical protein